MSVVYTQQDFEPFQGQSVELIMDDGTSLTCRLDRVEAGLEYEGGPQLSRPPFNLYFSSPPPMAPQGTFAFAFGPADIREIFIVPTAFADDRYLYRATFN